MIQWNKTSNDGRTVLEHNLTYGGTYNRGTVGLNGMREIYIPKTLSVQAITKVAESVGGFVREKTQVERWDDEIGDMVPVSGCFSCYVYLPLDEVGSTLHRVACDRSRASWGALMGGVK